MIECCSGFGELVNIRISEGRYPRLRTFLMTWIVSCWPADTFCPCAGGPMVIPCAAAATAQMEATRMDNNLRVIFETRICQEYSVCRYKYPTYLYVLLLALFLFQVDSGVNVYTGPSLIFIKFMGLKRKYTEIIINMANEDQPQIVLQAINCGSEPWSSFIRTQLDSQKYEPP